MKISKQMQIVYWISWYHTRTKPKMKSLERKSGSLSLSRCVSCEYGRLFINYSHPSCKQEVWAMTPIPSCNRLSLSQNKVYFISPCNDENWKLTRSSFDPDELIILSARKKVSLVMKLIDWFTSLLKTLLMFYLLLVFSALFCFSFPQSVVDVCFILLVKYEKWYAWIICRICAHLFLMAARF